MPYGFNDDKSKLNLAEIMLKSGDQVTIGSNASNGKIVCNGYLTNSSTRLDFTIPTMPIVAKSIDTTKDSQLTLVIRHLNGGYAEIDVSSDTRIVFGTGNSAISFGNNTNWVVSYQLLQSAITIRIDTKNNNFKWRQYSLNGSDPVIPNNTPVSVAVSGFFTLA